MRGKTTKTVQQMSKAAGLALVGAAGLAGVLNNKKEKNKESTGKVHIAAFAIPVAIIDRGDDNYQVSRRAGGLGIGIDAAFPNDESGRGKWYGINAHEIEHHKDGNQIDVHREEQINSVLNEKLGYQYVFMPKEIKDALYFDAANKLLWPLSHGLNDKVHKDASLDGFDIANKLFADGIIADIKASNNGYIPLDDVVWVHDYHLLSVPKFLKELAPDLPVGFFYHIPFPDLSTKDLEGVKGAEKFKAILENLLEADFIQFQTAESLQNFKNTLTNFDIADAKKLAQMSEKLTFNPIGIPKDSVAKSFDYNYKSLIPFEAPIIFGGGSSIPRGHIIDEYVGAAIDPNEFAPNLHQMVEKKTQEWILDDKGEIKPETKGVLTFNPDKIHIASVSRLDYTKGILELLDAYEGFLKQKKEDGVKKPGEKYQLTVVATTPRDIKEYVDYAKKAQAKMNIILKEYPGSFVFMPGIPNGDLALFNAIIDLAVAPSLEDGYLISIGEAFVARDTALKMNTLPIENQPSGVIVSFGAGISRQLEKGVSIPELSIIKPTADSIKEAILFHTKHIEHARQFPKSSQKYLTDFSKIPERVTTTEEFGKNALKEFDVLKAAAKKKPEQIQSSHTSPSLRR
jgi:trehalose-6-phosphate synthase